MFLCGRPSGWIGHQSSPQTDAPALNTCAPLYGKNWAVGKVTMAVSIRDRIKKGTGRSNGERETRRRGISHSFCVPSVLKLTSVCSPNGPKSQDTDGAAYRVAWPSESGVPPSIGIYAVSYLAQRRQNADSDARLVC
jgi:hypothetical protein